MVVAQPAAAGAPTMEKETLLEKEDLPKVKIKFLQKPT